MKSICVLLLVLFSLLQFSRTVYGRNNVEDYWRSVMKEQPVPQAIADLLENPPSSAEARRDLFVKDFKVKQTLIIYRRHGDPRRARSHVNIHGQEEIKRQKLEKQEGLPWTP